MLQSVGLQRVGHDWVAKQKQHITMGLPGGLVSKEPARNAGDSGLIPSLGRFPRERHSNQLHENPMDRGAWQAMTAFRMGENNSK